MFGIIMKMKQARNGKAGFSLVELLIYVAIFAVTAVFLVGILTTITRIQTRQSTQNTVNGQISFVSNEVTSLVHNSSLIDMTTGQATSTLKLRMPDSAYDPTYVYASGTAIYLEQGTSSPVALTNSSVSVNGFQVTKYENPGGPAIIDLSISMTYNSANPAGAVTATADTAIARVSAASFDSSVYPTAPGTLTLGTQANPWYAGYFNNNVNLGGQYGQVGLGTGFSGSTNVLLKANGDIGFSASNQGLILVSPTAGICYRLTVNASGTLLTAQTTCP